MATRHASEPGGCDWGTCLAHHAVLSTDCFCPVLYSIPNQGLINCFERSSRSRVQMNSCRPSVVARTQKCPGLLQERCGALGWARTYEYRSLFGLIFTALTRRAASVKLWRPSPPQRLFPLLPSRRAVLWQGRGCKTALRASSKPKACNDDRERARGRSNQTVRGKARRRDRPRGPALLCAVFDWVGSALEAIRVAPPMMSLARVLQPRERRRRSEQVAAPTTEAAHGVSPPPTRRAARRVKTGMQRGLVHRV